MRSSQSPLARKDELVVQEMPEEVLVYDLKTNKAHCLNETAAFVWKSCDGRKTVREITHAFEGQTGEAVGEDLVWLALDQLGEKELLAGEVEVRYKGENRREVIKKIGLAAVVAMPLVASLTAPTSAMAAASCACTAPANCPAQTTCPSTVNCNPTGICSP